MLLQDFNLELTLEGHTEGTFIKKTVKKSFQMALTVVIFGA